VREETSADLLLRCVARKCTARRSRSQIAAHMSDTVVVLCGRTGPPTSSCVGVRARVGAEEDVAARDVVDILD